MRLIGLACSLLLLAAIIFFQQPGGVLIVGWIPVLGSACIVGAISCFAAEFAWLPFLLRRQGRSSIRNFIERELADEMQLRNLGGPRQARSSNESLAA